MATGSPLDTDLVYLERDLKQYRLSWYDFTNKIGVDENDIVFVQRDIQYYSVRVGDIWDGTVLLEDTDMFLVERGVRGAFDPDNPDDPAYFGRLYHCNPEIGVYIEFELSGATSAEPEVTIKAGGDAWSNGMRPRIVTPNSGSHMLTTDIKEFTFQGAGVYGIMGYLKEFQISSPDVIDASLSETALWHDMNGRNNQFGRSLFSNIGLLTGAPAELTIRNAYEFAANTNFDFNPNNNPFDKIRIRFKENSNYQWADATRAFYNTTNLPGLNNAYIHALKSAAQMFAESDFAGPFWSEGVDHVNPPSWAAANCHQMFYNCKNYTGNDGFFNRVKIRSFYDPNKVLHGLEDASMMFEGSAFNSNIGGQGSNYLWYSANNMHRMFARSNFNATVNGVSGWEFFHSAIKDVSEMFADNPAFNKPVRLNFTNVSQQTPVNVEGMFRNTQSFAATGAMGEWVFFEDKIQGNSFANMFRDATGISDNPDMAGWDVSIIQDFSGMFANSTFSTDISDWDTQSATNMDFMFDNAATFDFDLTGWCVPLVPDEPVDFANTAVFPQAKHPQWGTCPVPIKGLPKIYDYTDRDYVNGDVGHTLRYDPRGELEIPAEKIIVQWQQKKQGESDFTELDGWLLYDSSTSGIISPALENSTLRVKETHQNVKYDADVVLYSNELKIGVAPQRQFWTFDYTGAPEDILKVDVSYAQIEKFDGADWHFVTYEQLPDFDNSTQRRQQNLKPGTYRIDTTYNNSWEYESSSDNFSSTRLNVHNTSTLGAVTKVEHMFAMKGYQGQDFSWLDTSKVTSMYNMFYGSRGNQLDVSNWDISNVTILERTFRSVSQFKGTGLETWGLGPKVTRASEMFRLSAAMNVDMSNMKLPKVKNAQMMFEGCRSQALNPPGEMFTNAGPSNAMNMFQNCVVFNGDISGFKMGVITDADNMFRNCHEFNSDSFQDADWTGQKLTGSDQMFQNCYKFSQSLSCLPRGFFKNCRVMDRTFEECHNFKGEGMAGLNFSSTFRFGNTFFNAGLSGDVDVTDWVIHTGGNVEFKFTFKRCKEVESFVGLPQWNTSRVVNMRSMFEDCDLLHQDDMYELDVANVTDVRSMFRGCDVFNADLSSWCVPKLGPANTHTDFSKYSAIENIPAKNPVWGQCPPQVVSQPVIQ